MSRIIVFLVSTVTLILVVANLSSFLAHEDPFDLNSGPSKFSASGISQTKLAKLKLRHAASSPAPYDVGIFGNSRALNISAQDIGSNSCRIFNFSLGGESLRASAALIEQLSSIRKVPRIVVVSVDHFELQMYNNPFFLSAWARLSHFSDDLDAAISSGANLREIATVVWRAIWTQTLAFQRMFEFAFLADTLNDVFKFDSDRTEAAKVYLSDGSRRSNITITEIPPRLSPTNSQILPWQLQHDLKRIADAKSAGAEAIILYESFLHPTSGKYFDENPSIHATRSRETFVRTCEDLGLICITDKPTMNPELPWSDASHPPRSVLGPFVGKLINRYSPDCRT